MQSQPSCDLNKPPYKSLCFQNELVPLRPGEGFYSLSGNGPFWGGPSVPATPPPWTSFSSPWRGTYAATGPAGALNMSLRDEPVVFGGIPESRGVWLRATKRRGGAGGPLAQGKTSRVSHDICFFSMAFPKARPPVAFLL